MSGSSRPLTGVAVAYEAVDIPSHAIPIVATLEDLEGFCSTGVSEGWGVVEGPHEVEPEVVGGGDIEAVAVVEEAGAVLALGQGDFWVALIAALDYL